MNELQALIERLKGNNKGCEDKCIDLQTLKFEAKESEMRLYDQSTTYWFKSDPKNPNDPKVIHGARQFTKLAGVPYSFFAKNPEHMKNQIISCWLPTLKPEKAQVLAKLRKAEDGYVIRAVLPVEFTNISNVDALSALTDAIGNDFTMEFAIGDERDDLILHVRLISNETFDACGEKCSTGFSIVVSELGASPISIETMLYRVSSKASIIASYGTEGYFTSNYEGIQSNDLKDLFPKLINNLKNQLPELKEKIQDAKDKVTKKEDIKELFKILRLRKGLSDKFHTLLFQEIENDSSVSNRWDFVNKMVILAKDFDVVSRLKIEKSAGEIIGLGFEKV
jgi:hypothetical protein